MVLGSLLKDRICLSSSLNIPENSPKAGVLVSVPGTGPAKEALIANAIPQTATITRNQAQLEVEYDGDPQFKNIEGTNLQYAVNTATPVIRVDDKNYYAVENAVWFVGAAPVGPWAVATSVPASDLLDSSQFLSALRHLRQGVPLHAGCRLRGLHSRVLRNGRVFHPPTVVYGTGFVLSALRRQLLVWSALHLRSRRGVYVEFGYGLEHHDRRRLHLWLSLLLSVVGAMGILRTLAAGGRLGDTATAAMPARTYTVAGAIPLTRVPGLPGRIPTPGTMVRQAEPLSRTRNAAPWELPVAAPIPTSTPATPSRGRGAVGYNPKTGIVAGGGAGYAGNMYSGEGAAGRGGFAYNTNTGAGVAAGSNNIYAGKDGERLPL